MPSVQETLASVAGSVSNGVKAAASAAAAAAPADVKDGVTYDIRWMERDYRGYLDSPPNPKWPNGAKVAVNFVLNYEEGGERCVEDGDPHAETVLHEFGSLLSVVPGARDPAVESQFQYGSRVATWRVLNLFKKYNIPITFYAVAMAFERNPEIVKRAIEDGHEIGSHCYKWMSYANMTDAEEEEYIRKAILSFERTCGKEHVPRGWYYGRPSHRSLPLVAKVHKELGYELLWWSDTYADDLPYYVPYPGAENNEKLVMLPYSLDNNGTHHFKFWLPGPGYGSDDAFAQHILDSVQTIREEAEAGERYGYVTVALHGRWIGRPGRFQCLKRIVETLNASGDVWFATREQIARHWRETNPPQ
ncbi:uncharacterized protein JCM10292_004442 [Rhodotorula paludigena]|uniref:uncharacterized protein n=1 Tax=Rhodotorula paludigena TaxID=86838 RepID=UPI003170456C